MTVTVIMPIYNAEEYLHDSIESLLKQTNHNWKLICIDDGSTDSSKDIITSYMKYDSRISLIQQNNSGPGVARARGIELVETEYFSILDSDDTYSSDFINQMITRAKETNADIIVPNVEFNYTDGSKVYRFEQYNLSENIVIKDGVTALSMTIPWKLHGWSMYKTSFARKFYTIENAKYSKFNSDEYITRLLYLKSKLVVLCNAMYLYRINTNSITRKASIKKLDYLKTLDKLVKLCKNEHINGQVIISVFNEYYCTLKSMNSFIKQLKPEDQKKACKTIRSYYKNSYKKQLTFDIIKAAKFRTKVKFLISKFCYLIIK